MPPDNIDRPEWQALAINILVGVAIGGAAGWFYLAMTAQRVAALLAIAQ
jgi:pimeloyl-ACP methyl ester carboxylesterase